MKKLVIILEDEPGMTTILRDVSKFLENKYGYKILETNYEAGIIRINTHKVKISLKKAGKPKGEK